MLKLYRNRFVEAIRSADFSPELFYAFQREISGLPALVIELKKTPIKFAVLRSKSDYHQFFHRFTQFAPGFPDTGSRPQQDEFGATTNWETIDFILGQFVGWLAMHVQPYLDEQAAPDLWSRINELRPLLSPDAFDDKNRAPLDGEEQSLIALAVNEYRVTLHGRLTLSAEQKNLLDARFRYLTTSLERLSRHDWQALAIYNVLCLAVSFNLNAETEAAILRQFQQTITVAMKTPRRLLRTKA